MKGAESRLAQRRLPYYASLVGSKSSIKGVGKKTMGRMLKRMLGLLRSAMPARREAEQVRRQLKEKRDRLKATRQQLKATRQQLKATRQQYRETRQQLIVSRRHLEQAARINEQMHLQSMQLGLQFRDVARDYLLCLMPKGSVCAEIGVHKGEFSRQIFDVVKPERLHLIDPWQQGEGLFGKQAAGEQSIMDERYAEVQALFAEEQAAERVRIHRNLSSELVDDFEDSYFDWIYIDGNHLYEYVKQDLELYYPKVKDGGYLAGDDYGVAGWWDNGIQKAVDEFVSQRPDLTLEVKSSQFIIWKKGSG